MGASQSTGGANPASGESVEVKTSYYELLGVERTATDDEIKRAYRRKALELHPDRNFGDVDRTTALFAEVQSAYEVLSDPQERSWYDAHEGDILRGGSGEGGGDSHFEGNMRVTTADDISRMLGKFRSNVEFSDSPTGFFGFLRETFEQLAKEEEYSADWEGVDIAAYPSFGHKADEYDGVVRDFYAGWSGFVTHKTFAWKDKWRLSDAPDRRVRRLMEKENKQARDEGKREFNEAVRTLVQFVRKRDPRYTPTQQTVDERAKEQREKTKAQAARARAAHAAKTDDVVPEWAMRRDEDDEDEESEEEIEEEHYECVACHKTFKSERQYDAHERSKKHQKAVYALRKKMRKDNANLHLDDDVGGNHGITPIDVDDNENTEDASDLDSAIEDVTEEVDNVKISETISDAPEDSPTKSAEPEDDTSETSPEPASDSDYASRAEIESRISSTVPNDGIADDTVENPLSSSTTPTPGVPKIGKAAQKRAKKAAKQAEEEAQPGDSETKCGGCNEEFPSKTKLFDHLKKFPKHATLISTAGKGGGKKKGKKK
ncbi:hypothetical protein B0J11DRAFT_423467 [Dendryphion nanum]|uniref:DnaJ-domain-containing protein n=1 Tax=Dendryphion nanum TaxID=256645 RepID=A0A9P9EEU0_9PLEO|nr:hypothetical protein B0J11DRAFT_423467 [Dendryphion nanum]